MKNILIIGDSHTEKLGYTIWPQMIEFDPNHLYTYTEKRYFTNEKQKDGDYLILRDNLTTYEGKDKKIWISSHPGRSALNFNWETFASGSQKDLLDEWNLESSIVMPAFGYIDIRNWLPQHNINNYKDAKTVAATYVANVLNKFDKAKIIFIEPNPQFICFITSNWAKMSGDPDNEFEERYEEHIKFVDELHNQCKIHGLQEPINIREILETDMIETYMQEKSPIQVLLNDHMRLEYYSKISKYIIDNV